MTDMIPDAARASTLTGAINLTTPSVQATSLSSRPGHDYMNPSSTSGGAGP